MIPYDLQFFADDSADLGAESSLAQGIDADVTTEGAGPSTADEGTEAQENFESLIKGKYKDDFNNAIKSRLDKRLRGSKKEIEDLKGYKDGVAPLIAVMAQKYGLDAENVDVNALANLINNDNSLYEEEAFKRGMDVETFKQFKQLERDNERFKQQEAMRAEEASKQEYWNGIFKQADELKQFYPEFDMDAEMDNEQFARLVSVNVPVKTAYEICHKDEILAQGMKYAVEKTATQVSNNIQARGQRPLENGLSSQAAASASIDPTKLTREQYQDLRRRAEKGERITFI